MEITVRHQGVDQKADVQIIKETLWVHYNGRTFAVEASAPGSKRKKSSLAGSSDQVLAPMPGKVTKILVKVGQEIAKGQAVLVMEAMKMEYTLKAEIAGKIARIDCAPLDQVALGKALVKIEPAKV